MNNEINNDENKCIKEREKCIYDWLDKNEIGATQEKRKKIARCMFWIVLDENISNTDINNIIDRRKFMG